MLPSCWAFLFQRGQACEAFAACWRIGVVSHILANGSALHHGLFSTFSKLVPMWEFCYTSERF